MSQFVRHENSENLSGNMSDSFSDPNKLASRRLSCLSVSIVAHVALLFALAVVPDSVKEMIVETDTSKSPQGNTDGNVELIDNVQRDSGRPATVISASAPVTETENDVEVPTPVAAPAPVTPLVVAKQPQPQPKPQPIKKAAIASQKPTAKPVAQTVQPAPQEKVLTDENDDVAPVAAVVPPETVEQKPEPTPEPEEKNEEKPEEKSAAVVVAPQPEQKPEEVTETQSAAVSNAPAQASAEENQSAESENTGPANNNDGQGNAAVVTGPIRDASQLKALPGNPNPVYPARDRLARKEGTSVILGRVAADGRVSNVRVERSSGSQAMDAASTETFKKWRFQSGQQGWVRKPFQFRLVGEAKEVR